MPGLLGGRRIVGVDAGHCAEDDRGIGDVAGHRPRGVLIGRDRDDAGTTHQPDRRLDPDDPVRARRAHDRSVRLGPDAHRGEIRCHADGRAGARATGVAIEDVRHVRLSADATPAAR